MWIPLSLRILRLKSEETNILYNDVYFLKSLFLRLWKWIHSTAENLFFMWIFLTQSIVYLKFSNARGSAFEEVFLFHIFLYPFGHTCVQRLQPIQEASWWLHKKRGTCNIIPVQVPMHAELQTRNTSNYHVRLKWLKLTVLSIKSWYRGCPWVAYGRFTLW